MPQSDSRERLRGAIALGYDVQSDSAPKVLAKGSGELANRIIQIAKESKIIIQEDPLLYESLRKLEVGDQIPVKLYQVVAELLAYVYRVNRKKKKGII
ncbi:MAG: EscU/YscU/HrcU family type III secretion system export apparatus switch protein [Bacillota bacterium]